MSVGRKHPWFPPEIEKLCFELAARASPAFAPTLSVVCQRVQAWVECIIYETLYVIPTVYRYRYDPAQVWEKHILPTFQSRPAEFFAANVRNLCIFPDVSITFRRVALSKCTSVRHLGLYEDKTLFNVHGIGSGSAFATSVTLSSLFTTKKALSEMISLGIELPNLSFLGLHGDKEQFMPSLDWLPELKTVELEFDRPSIDIVWENNAVEVLANTPQLQELWINIKPDSIGDVEESIDEDLIPSHVTVYIRNADVHENLVSEWRARIGGRCSYKHSVLDSDGQRPSKRVEYCACSCWDIEEELDDDPLGLEALRRALARPQS
ncbi:hypothetical protein H0H92_001101 [Tricholoma furcatifolium]|nr:hypothetical protein H0H92_001101 [Tricholoma furcatifolium]